MAFKIGDMVSRKGFDEDEMSIHGFLTNRADNYLTEIKEEPATWVVCKYQKKDGSFGHEVFHSNELELVVEEE